MSPQNHSVPLVETQYYVINPTNPRSALDDGVEHRLHVSRRAADDAEHLGRRRLMLQRLAQLRVALAEFFEQAHVFDGDHGLVGEGFEKSDLFFGKRPDFRYGESKSHRWQPLREATGCRAWSDNRCLLATRGFRKFSLEHPPGSHEYGSFHGQQWLDRYITAINGEVGTDEAGQDRPMTRHLSKQRLRSAR